MLVFCSDCGATQYYADDVLRPQDQWFFLRYDGWLKYYQGQTFGEVRCPACWDVLYPPVKMATINRQTEKKAQRAEERGAVLRRLRR